MTYENKSLIGLITYINPKDNNLGVYNIKFFAEEDGEVVK